MDIIEKLKIYAKQKSLSYQKLAEMFGVSYSAIYTWMTKKRNISPKHKARIEELLENNMRETISIPLETLEEIKQVSPSLEPLIKDLFASSGTLKVGLLEKQIAEQAMHLPISMKSLYGLANCLIGQEFRKE